MKKVLNAALIFAFGFVAGKAYASRDMERRCNEIVEKEFASFKAYREATEKRKKAMEEAESEETQNEGIETEEEEEEEEEDSEEFYISKDDSEGEKSSGTIIQKNEYGVLNYEVETLEIFGDMHVEDTYGNLIKDPEQLLGIADLNDLYDSDDQTSAYVRNDETQMYYEVIREV